jgi:site-specific DNA recombinase
MRAVIYIRVSDKSQVDGYSLEDQERAYKEYAYARGWTVTRVYADEGRSAYRDVRRPQFEALLDAARRKQFDVVIIYKFDRFARKTLPQLQMAAELEWLNIAIHSTTEPVDRRTAAGKLSFAMMAAVAQFSSDTTGERVRDARKAAARQGDWVGPVPVGYIKNEAGLLVPSDDAEAVQLAFRLYATGQHSYTTVAHALNDAGWRIPHVKTGTRRLFTKFAVEELLQNDAYIGKTHCQGATYDGKQVPLVDEVTWQQVRAVQASRAGRRGRPAGSVVREMSASLLGLAYCAKCSSRMWHQPPQGRRLYPYYQCSKRAVGAECDAPMVRGDHIEVALSDVVKTLALPEEWHEEILRRAAIYATSSEAPAPVDAQEIQAQLRSLRLDFVDERIDEVTYQREKARLQALLGGERPAQVTADVKAMAPLLWNLPGLLEQATPLERHGVYKEVFERVWLEDNKIRALTPTPSYEAMMLAARDVIRQSGPGGDRTHDHRFKRPLLYR